MFTQRTKMYVGILVAIMIIGIIGCNLLDRDKRSSPTEPIEPSHRLNFWAGGALYHEIAVYLPESKKGEFMVNLPEAGDYAIEYTVKRDGVETGPFYVLSRVKAGGAVLFIGLLNGDTLWEATLYGTEIPSEATPIFENDHAALYYKPGEGNVTIAKVVEFPPPLGSIALLFMQCLVQDGAICPGTYELTRYGTLIVKY